jgi:hypothetical protein
MARMVNQLMLDVVLGTIGGVASQSLSLIQSRYFEQLLLSAAGIPICMV